MKDYVIKMKELTLNYMSSRKFYIDGRFQHVSAESYLGKCSQNQCNEFAF